MEIVNKLEMTRRFLRAEVGFSGQVRNRPFLKQSVAYGFDSKFILKVTANDLKTIKVDEDGSINCMDMTNDGSKIFLLSGRKIKVFDDEIFAWNELDLGHDLNHPQIKVSSLHSTAICLTSSEQSLIPTGNRHAKIIGVKYVDKELKKIYEFELSNKLIAHPIGFTLNESNFFIGARTEIEVYGIQSGEKVTSIELSDEESDVYGSSSLMVSKTEMILFERHFDENQFLNRQAHVLPGPAPKKSFKVIKFVNY